MTEDTPPLLRAQPIDAAEIRRLDQRIDGLKELVAAHDLRYTQRFLDSATAVTAALNAAKEAVIKAEVAAEKRFEGVNEFRAALGDQQRTLMPRAEADIRFDALKQSIEKLATANVTQSAKSTGKVELWGFIVGVLGVIALIVSFVRGFTKP